MSQTIDGNTKTFLSSAAISRFARVKLGTDGRIATAGLADRDIGTAQNLAGAANVPVAVKLRTAAGTHKMIAAEPFAAGAQLYTEIDGKVQDTAEATAYQVCTALEAAAAANDVVEVLYNAHGDTPVPAE